MPANTAPIFTLTPNIGFNSYLVTANPTADLISGTIYLLFTAGANGSYAQKLRLRSSPAGNTSATVLRVWLNNGASTGTATNNILFTEVTLPLTTASGTAATPDYEVPLNFALPAGWRVYGTIHTGSTNGWAGTVIGGDY